MAHMSPLFSSLTAADLSVSKGVQGPKMGQDPRIRPEAQIFRRAYFGHLIGILVYWGLVWGPRFMEPPLQEALEDGEGPLRWKFRGGADPVSWCPSFLPGELLCAF